MPSTLHEVLLELFDNQPDLAPQLLSALGWSVPQYDRADTACTDLSERTPTEYRADSVVVLTSRSRPVLAVVVEVQLRPDHRKRWSWPVYLTTLRARLRCPVVLLVLCRDAPTTRWAGKQIDLGFGAAVVRPIALGPEQVPVVTDPETAIRSPELAVLAAIAHGNNPDRVAVFEAMLAGMDHLAETEGTAGEERARMYCDLVELALGPGRARAILEDLMTTAAHREYLSEFFRSRDARGRAEGRAEGQAEGQVAATVKSLQLVLKTRGIQLSDTMIRRVQTCTNVDQLLTWTRRAITADTADQVFDNDATTSF